MVMRHPRSKLTAAATCDLSDSVYAAVDRHGLTTAEMAMILAELAYLWSQFVVKDERHVEPT